MTANYHPQQVADIQVTLPDVPDVRGMARTSKGLHASIESHPHLVLIVTSAMSVAFFRGQIRRLGDAGFQVTLMCSPGQQTKEAEVEGAKVIAISVERDIAFFRDLRSLWILWRTLRRIRADIVNVGTPKAGLLGGIAARLALVPHRVYTLHGLRFETASGWRRSLLKLMEYVSCRNAQHVRCVSPSVRERAVHLGVLDGRKAYVIGAGSANGIDCDRYRPTKERSFEARKLRSSLGIPGSAPVIGFVGRFTRDKGITELYDAFIRLRQLQPELRLLLVGDFETGDPVDPRIQVQLQSDAHVHLTGRVPDAAPYYHLMDIFALPTYREGLSVVCLEAQASGIPVITTTATGAVDSVLKGVTGKVVPPRNAGALAAALLQLLADPQKRKRMGEAALDWINRQFDQELIWDALIQDYGKILRQETDEQREFGQGFVKRSSR